MSGRQIDRRRLLGSMTGVALAGAIDVPRAAPALAQGATPVVAGNAATLVVTGAGEASVAATGAVMQLIIRRPFDPNTGIDNTAKGAGGGVNAGNGQVEPLTGEDVQPIVEALLEAGVPEKQILVVALPAGPYAGAFGQGSAAIAVELDAAALAGAQSVADAAVAAGDEAGLLFDPINLAYISADCGAAEADALVSAVADGQLRAEALSAALGVTLGGLVSAAQQPTFNLYYGYGGGASGACIAQASLETATRSYLPAFDPNAEPELEIAAQIVMTYSIA